MAFVCKPKEATELLKQIGSELDVYSQKSYWGVEPESLTNDVKSYATLLPRQVSTIGSAEGNADPLFVSVCDRWEGKTEHGQPFDTEEVKKELQESIGRSGGCEMRTIINDETVCNETDAKRDDVKWEQVAYNSFPSYKNCLPYAGIDGLTTETKQLHDSNNSVQTSDQVTETINNGTFDTPVTPIPAQMGDTVPFYSSPYFQDQRGMFPVQPKVDFEQLTITRTIILDQKSPNGLPGNHHNNYCSQFMMGGLSSPDFRLNPTHTHYASIGGSQWAHLSNNDSRSTNLPAICLPGSSVENQAPFAQSEKSSFHFSSEIGEQYNSHLSAPHQASVGVASMEPNYPQPFIYPTNSVSHQIDTFSHTNTSNGKPGYHTSTVDSNNYYFANASVPFAQYDMNSGTTHNQDSWIKSNSSTFLSTAVQPHGDFSKYTGTLEANGYNCTPHNADSFTNGVIVPRQSAKKNGKTGVVKRRKVDKGGENDKRPFACSVPNCGKKYFREMNLIVHMKKHTGERPHACEYCDRKFQRSDQLKRHIRKHTGEKPYACVQCGRKFARSDHLKTHYQSHDAKPYLCRYLNCKKKFARPEDLSRHQSRVHFHNNTIA